MFLVVVHRKIAAQSTIIADRARAKNNGGNFATASFEPLDVLPGACGRAGLDGKRHRTSVRTRAFCALIGQENLLE